jgi:peptidoglycan L-alanyl-D-glutamate endopeptidase CwlK
MLFALYFLLYFMAAAFVVAVVIFPDLRARLQEKIRQFFRYLHHSKSNIEKTQAEILNRSRSRAQRFGAFVREHRLLVSLTCALLIAPSIVALIYRNNHDFVLLQERRVDSRIQILLEGERLRAPEPLPPEVFTTLEVELLKPKLATASRNWEKLDPDFQQRLLTVYQIMKEEHGYEMHLIEGYRSPERQNELAALGGRVTNARACQSYHQYGLAADSAFMLNGKLVISEKGAWAMQGYKLYGETAKKVGMVWGGDWRSIKDLGHVELRKPGVVLGKDCAPST